MKRLITILIVIMITASLVACGVYSGPDADVSVTHTDAEPEAEPDYWAVAEYEAQMEGFASQIENVEFDEAKETDNPLVVLEVSEDWARQHGGAYLRRGGTLYTLGSKIPSSTADVYGVGRFYSSKEDGNLYCGAGPDSTRISMGDIPVITLKEDDEVITYNDTWVTLFVSDFSGYSPRIIDPEYGADALIILTGPYTSIGLDKTAEDTFKVSDADGNLVKNYRDLAYGETYTVSWFEGTTYNELEITADCSYYKLTGSFKGDYTVSGELNKNGFATYDFSAIPAGLYCINSSSGDNFIWIQ